jgi:hypothetical protein
MKSDQRVRPRYTTLFSDNGSSRAYVEGGSQAGYGPDYDDSDSTMDANYEDGDPLAEKHEERRRAARAIVLALGGRWDDEPN